MTDQSFITSTTARPRMVGQVIREFRQAGKWRQADLATRMAMSQQYLSEIETNKKDAPLALRWQLSEVLGIPPERLGLAPQSYAAGATSAPEVEASRSRWLAERAWLNEHRGLLGRRAADWYPQHLRVGSTSLIAAAEWLPSAPVDLDDVRLALLETPMQTHVTGREAGTLPVRPLHGPQTHFDTYTAAIRHLHPPRLFESRPSYRFAGGSISKGAMQFGLAAYFDKLDISEALGHELAIACMNSTGRTSPSPWHAQLPFRESIGDPFDPYRRAIIPAITTLTIRLRRDPDAPTFLLHWRDPEKVATAAGVFDVVPAGEFQPSTVALWDRQNDFSLWKNMVREYSEELLGTPEHDGTRTQPIDYERWDLYRALSDARQDGKVRAWILGMGLDALTLAATILTCVVIDDDVFADLFGDIVRFNDEGEIVGTAGNAAEGFPFTEASVAQLLGSRPMAAPGAAALTLAWDHRDLILM